MKKQQFLIEIKAPRERVWSTLWEDKTFRDWGNIIDEGQYMVGEIKEGNEVQFISSVSGYGVTSLVEKLVPNEFVLFRQMADTMDSGKREREMEWTGGTESYSLAKNDGVTTLTVDIDVPLGQEETFKVRFPKALERVKTLAEKKE
jgi:Activator of Hsp90 ATPase homolog 1-like protein